MGHDTLGIPATISYYMTSAPPNDTNTKTCCGPNPVHQNTNCTVWCEIPDRYLANITHKDPKRPEKSIEYAVDVAFSECFLGLGGSAGVSYVHLNEADGRGESAAAVGPAAAPGLGSLLLMAGVMYLALF
jgi:hypothetical protein